MNLTVDEMLKYCRLCQSKEGVFKVISDDLNRQVFECTRIKIDDDLLEVLPSTICEECKKTICEFCKFLQTVRKVDVELRKRFCIENSGKLIQMKTVIRKESEDKKYKCPVCLKKYSRLKNLQSHKRKHSVLLCMTCEVIFNDTHEKSYHVCKIMKQEDSQENDNTLTNTSSENKKFENEVGMEESISTKDWFNEEFTKDVEIEQIINKDDGGQILFQQPDSQNGKSELKNEGNFKCKICSKEFSWRIDWWLHKKNHKTTFTCKWENCNKTCTSAYTLKTHEMNHEGKRPFLCVTCGKGFVTKNSLNCHEKIHLEIKPYSCELCNIGFSVRSNLRAHEQKYHEGIRFYCSQCTRAYISKSSLERHERIHTGVREFQCETCPSAFYTSKELIKHQRYHQGIRKYKCEQCFKSFFEKHHLTIHLRVHTGEKPYTCKIPGCGKSFTESQKLSRHLKARHPKHTSNV